MGQTQSQPPPQNQDLFSFIVYGYLIVTALNLLGKYSKSKKSHATNTTESLEDIIGLEDVKKEIEYYMDFIKNKENYESWNVKVPKGVLLVGSPGTGKTMLVRALANELELPIISASGSEFIEKYVGIGASRVRNLFEKARKHDSCIIFIDEIDAVGRARDFDNNSERASTVNQLLTEMDGFSHDDNIIIFAATNLVKTLDPALLRSGRFDKKVYFDLPNMNERKLMFEKMTATTNIGNLNFDSLAERSAGLSGADIATVINQAKIIAIQNDYKNISDSCIQEALDEVMIGKEKRERLVSPEEKKRICFHEAGHALMGFVLKDTNAPVKVSVIPRGANALGFSQPKPVLKYLHTRNEILSKIAVLLAGRCAEIIIYDQVSSGASDDIEKISDLVRKYFTHWGMDNEGVFLPHRLSEDSDTLQTKCQDLTYQIEGAVINILKQHRKYLDKIANKLLSKETLSYTDIKKILKSKRESSIIIDNFL